VAVQQREDGRWHANCRVWVPTPGTPVDTTDIMQYLRGQAALYDVRAVSYDPRFFDVPAKYLEDEGLPMVEIPQSVERMTVAIGGLYEAIMGKDITHEPDELFTTQVLNAVPRFNDRGFTLTKSKSRGHIDAAIALALALERAQRPTPASEPMVTWA
jgi:phage terminase large subunit-like protein